MHGVFLSLWLSRMTISEDLLVKIFPHPTQNWESFNSTRQCGETFFYIIKAPEGTYLIEGLNESEERLSRRPEKRFNKSPED